MKRHYVHLWLLLASAFAVFALASAFELELPGGYRLKSAGIADALFAERAGAEMLPAAIDADSIFLGMADSAVIVASEPQFPMPTDTAAQTILFIGDSMLEGLGPRMAAYAEKNGHTLYNVIWYSSTSEVWGSSDKLRHYIDMIRPTFIFVSLGANELFVKDIKTKRADHVGRILEDIGDIPYLWIGPPNWKDDTGINELVSGKAGRGRFFLSNGMHFDRASDGAHPTRKSAQLWLDSVMRWMPANALHPIRMDMPDKTTARAKQVFIHQPSER